MVNCMSYTYFTLISAKPVSKLCQTVVLYYIWRYIHQLTFCMPVPCHLINKYGYMALIELGETRNIAGIAIKLLY